MFKKFLKRNSSLIIGISIFVVMMLMALFAGLTDVGRNHPIIYALNSWFKRHSYWVVLWHILLILAIYFGWDFKVERAIKAQKSLKNKPEIDKKEIRKLKKIRWYLIAGILLFDLIIYL